VRDWVALLWRGEHIRVERRESADRQLLRTVLSEMHEHLGGTTPGVTRGRAISAGSAGGEATGARARAWCAPYGGGRVHRPQAFWSTTTATPCGYCSKGMPANRAV